MKLWKIALLINCYSVFGQSASAEQSISTVTPVGSEPYLSSAQVSPTTTSGTNNTAFQESSLEAYRSGLSSNASVSRLYESSISSVKSHESALSSSLSSAFEASISSVKSYQSALSSNARVASVSAASVSSVKSYQSALSSNASVASVSAASVSSVKSYQSALSSNASIASVSAASVSSVKSYQSALSSNASVASVSAASVSSVKSYQSALSSNASVASVSAASVSSVKSYQSALSSNASAASVSEASMSSAKSYQSAIEANRSVSVTLAYPSETPQLTARSNESLFIKPSSIYSPSLYSIANVSTLVFGSSKNPYDLSHSSIKDLANASHTTFPSALNSNTTVPEISEATASIVNSAGNASTGNYSPSSAQSQLGINSNTSTSTAVVPSGFSNASSVPSITTNGSRAISFSEFKSSTALDNNTASYSGLTYEKSSLSNSTLKDVPTSSENRSIPSSAIYTNGKDNSSTIIGSSTTKNVSLTTFFTKFGSNSTYISVPETSMPLSKSYSSALSLPFNVSSVASYTADNASVFSIRSTVSAASTAEIISNTSSRAHSSSQASVGNNASIYGSYISSKMQLNSSSIGTLGVSPSFTSQLSSMEKPTPSSIILGNSTSPIGSVISSSSGFYNVSVASQYPSTSSTAISSSLSNLTYSSVFSTNTLQVNSSSNASSSLMVSNSRSGMGNSTIKSYASRKGPPVTSFNLSTTSLVNLSASAVKTSTGEISYQTTSTSKVDNSFLGNVSTTPYSNPKANSTELLSTFSHVTSNNSSQKSEMKNTSAAGYSESISTISSSYAVNTSIFWNTSRNQSTSIPLVYSNTANYSASIGAVSSSSVVSSLVSNALSYNSTEPRTLFSSGNLTATTFWTHPSQNRSSETLTPSTMIWNSTFYSTLPPSHTSSLASVHSNPATESVSGTASEIFKGSRSSEFNASVSSLSTSAPVAQSSQLGINSTSTYSSSLYLQTTSNTSSLAQSVPTFSISTSSSNAVGTRSETYKTAVKSTGFVRSSVSEFTNGSSIIFTHNPFSSTAETSSSNQTSSISEPSGSSIGSSKSTERSPLSLFNASKASASAKSSFGTQSKSVPTTNTESHAGSPISFASSASKAITSYSSGSIVISSTGSENISTREPNNSSFVNSLISSPTSLLYSSNSYLPNGSNVPLESFASGNSANSARSIIPSSNIASGNELSRTQSVPITATLQNSSISNTLQKTGLTGQHASAQALESASGSNNASQSTSSPRIASGTNSAAERTTSEVSTLFSNTSGKLSTSSDTAQGATNSAGPIPIDSVTEGNGITWWTTFAFGTDTVSRYAIVPTTSYSGQKVSTHTQTDIISVDTEQTSLIFTVTLPAGSNVPSSVNSNPTETPGFSSTAIPAHSQSTLTTTVTVPCTQESCQAPSATKAYTTVCTFTWDVPAPSECSAAKDLTSTVVISENSKTINLPVTVPCSEISSSGSSSASSITSATATQPPLSKSSSVATSGIQIISEGSTSSNFVNSSGSAAGIRSESFKTGSGSAASLSEPSLLKSSVAISYAVNSSSSMGSAPNVGSLATGLLESNSSVYSPASGPTLQRTTLEGSRTTQSVGSEGTSSYSLSSTNPVLSSNDGISSISAMNPSLSTTTTEVTISCTQSTCTNSISPTIYTTICSFTYPVPTQSECATATELTSTVRISENSRVISVPVTIPCSAAGKSFQSTGERLSSSAKSIPSGTESIVKSTAVNASLTQSPSQVYSPSYTIISVPCHHTEICSRSGYLLSTIYPAPSVSNSNSICVSPTVLTYIADGRTSTVTTSVICSSQARSDVSQTIYSGTEQPTLSSETTRASSYGSSNTFSHEETVMTSHTSISSAINSQMSTASNYTVVSERSSTSSVSLTRPTTVPSKLSTVTTTVSVPCTQPTCNTVPTTTFYTTVCSFTIPAPQPGECSKSTDIVSTVVISENSMGLTVPITIPCTATIPNVPLGSSGTSIYSMPSGTGGVNSNQSQEASPHATGMYANSIPSGSLLSSFPSRGTAPSVIAPNGTYSSGYSPSGSPENGAPTTETSRTGNSASGNPAGSSAASGTPASGYHATGSPATGSPATGSPERGTPSSGSPASGSPASGSPNAPGIPGSQVTTMVTVPCTHTQCQHSEFSTPVTINVPTPTSSGQCMTTTVYTTEIVISSASTSVVSAITLPCGSSINPSPEKPTNSVQSGTPASGTPANGTPANGTPANGPPAKGPPASGSPASGSAASVPPSSGPPATGSPASGSPASVSPASVSPASVSPASVSPASGSPASGSPASGSPASGSPASGSHSGSSPANGSPSGVSATNPNPGSGINQTTGEGTNTPYSEPSTPSFTVITVPCHHTEICSRSGYELSTIYPVPAPSGTLSPCSSQTVLTTLRGTDTDTITTYVACYNPSMPTRTLSSVVSNPTISGGASESLSSSQEVINSASSNPTHTFTKASQPVHSPSSNASAPQTEIPSVSSQESTFSGAPTVTQASTGQQTTYGPGNTMHSTVTFTCPEKETCTETLYTTVCYLTVPPTTSPNQCVSPSVVTSTVTGLNQQSILTIPVSIPCESSIPVSSVTSAYRPSLPPAISNSAKGTSNPASGSPESGTGTGGAPATGSPTSGTHANGTPTTGSPSSETPATGPPASGTHTSETPTSGNPASGTPASGSPASGSPERETPASGNPASGNPASGNPASGNPASGNPASGNPASGNPASGSPASGTPASGSPATGSPATGTPASGTPANGSPASGSPASGSPASGSPASGTPASEAPTSASPNASGTPGSQVTTMVTVQCTHTQCQHSEYSTPITINVPTPTSSGQCMTTTVYTTQIVVSSASKSVVTMITLPCGSSVNPSRQKPSNSVQSGTPASGTPATETPASRIPTGGTPASGSPASGTPASGSPGTPGSQVTTIVTVPCTHTQCQHSEYSTPITINVPTPTSTGQCMTTTLYTTEIVISSASKSVVTTITLPCGSSVNPSPQKLSNSVQSRSPASSTLTGGTPTSGTPPSGSPTGRTPASEAPAGSSSSGSPSSSPANGSPASGSPNAPGIPGSQVTTMVTVPCTHSQCQHSEYSTPVTINVPTPTSSGQCMTSTVYTTQIVISSASTFVASTITLPCGSSINPSPEKSSTSVQSGTPASGSPATGSPRTGTPARGTHTSGTPATGSPASGPPTSGSPASGSPERGTPASGSPASGSPASGSPERGTPATGSPATGSPATGSPATGTPATGTPATGTPASKTPTNGSPASGSPASGSPASGSPNAPGTPGSQVTTMVTVPCTHTQCQHSEYSTPITINVPTPTSSGQCMTTTVYTTQIVISSASTSVVSTITLPCGSSINPVQPSNNPQTSIPASGTPASGTPASGTPASGSPATGSPASGSPATGTPATGTPATGSPASGSPNAPGIPGSQVTTMVTVPCTHTQCQHSEYSTPVTINVPTPTSSGQCMTTTVYTTQIVISSASTSVVSTITLPCGSSINPVQPSNNPQTSIPASGTPASGTPASGSPASGSPATGSPATGSPATGSPASKTPANGSPASGSPNAPGTPGSQVTTMVTVPCTHTQCQHSEYSTPVTINVPTPTSSGQCMTTTVYTTQIVISSASTSVVSTITLPCGSSINPVQPSNNPQTSILASGTPASGTPASGSPASGSPASGSPASGSPATGSPTGGTPASGSPATGSPATGSPATGSPTGGTPTGGTPASGTPASGSPATGSPASGSPATGTPATGTPATGSPASGSPNAPGIPGSQVTTMVTVPCTHTQCQHSEYSTPVTINVPTPTSSGQCMTTTVYTTEIVISSASTSVVSAITLPCGSSINPSPEKPTNSIQSGTPASGFPASGSPATGSPATGSPTGGTPTGGTPASGSPATGSPATGSPATGSPASGSPSTGTPATGTPATGSPASGSPNAPGIPGSQITTMVTVPCTHTQCQHSEYSTPVTINVPTPTSSGQCMTTTVYTTEIVISSASTSVVSAITLPCGSSINPSTEKPTNSIQSGTPASGTPANGTPTTGTPASGAPSSGTPASGSPERGTLASGSPSSGTLASGSPASGSPSSGSPTSGSPASGSPASGSPASGSPATGSPATGSPASGSPASGTPASGTPAGTTPASATPASATPASGSPNSPGMPGSHVTTMVTVPCTHTQCQHSEYSTPVTINVPTPTSTGQCMTTTVYTTQIVISSASTSVVSTITLPCGSSINPVQPSNNPQTSLPASQSAASGSPASSTPTSETPTSGTPVSGIAASETPANGSPFNGSPASGTPESGSPATGSPATGSPATGSPATGSPATGSPASSSPASGTAASGSSMPQSSITEAASSIPTFSTIDRNSASGLSGIVITVSTLSPTTTCPTSELTYMIQHGSSTLLEGPAPSIMPQEATVNSNLLSSTYVPKKQSSEETPSSLAVATTTSPAVQVSSSSSPSQQPIAGPGSTSPTGYPEGSTAQIANRASLKQISGTTGISAVSFVVLMLLL